MMRYLKALCSKEGVSGQENAVREYVQAALEKSPAAIQITCDPLGNLIARVTGQQRAARTLLFAAHMDEVGIMVTGITEEGYLRFTTVGGVQSSVLYGRRVRIRGLPGVIAAKAIHLCTADEKNVVPAASKLLIDIGADSRAQAEAHIHPGDVGVFDSAFEKLENGLVKGRGLDDRAGCAILLKLVEEIPPYDLVLAFTVQEEVGLRGAKTAAFAVQPDIAVIVDATTAADIPGVCEDRQVCRIGGGAVISFMDKRTLYDKPLYDHILALAKENNIKTQPKTMVAGGNDAGAIQQAGGGARVAAVSLPCRYLHSPSCVLSKKDMGEALALFRVLAGALPI